MTAWLFDGHVHVHRTTDVAAMLSAAARNFTTTAASLGSGSWRGVLLLSEMGHRHWFDEIVADAGGRAFGAWRLIPAGSQRSCTVRAISQPANADAVELTLVAGRQVITSENIEVLALGTRHQISDGSSLEATVSAAQEAGALVVLPWGAGKWLGRRGRLVERALATPRACPIFAGDNHGRPRCLGEPAAFAIARARGLPVLPGTDPLGLPGHEAQVGMSGFSVDGSLPEDLDGRVLLERLRDPARVRSYGRHVGPVAFLRNQIALRVRGVRRP